jgi:hypothetical protein
MILQHWRARLTYVAMSAFVAWHTAATVIAPAPEVSTLVQALRVPLGPYLSLFRLDNMWDFFSPNVGRGSQFRYIIEDVRGNHHPFAPTANLSWFHPTFFWFGSLFDAVMANPEAYADSAAAFLCRKHASLHPVSVIMLEAAGEDFTPEDYLAGKDPMSSEFVTVTTVKRVSCDGPQHSSA